MREYSSEAADLAAPVGAQEVNVRAKADVVQDEIVHRTELVISHVLRGGVLLSAVIITAGVILFYLRDAQSAHGLLDHPYPHSLADVMSGLMLGNPIAIIALGLLLLLSTPVVRVAVSIFAFAVERDWRYVMITSLVLAILIASFLLGKGGA
jgi:uncharacterized membrane protein